MSVTLTERKVRKPNTTGRRLQRLRIERGLSPEALGNSVGVSGRTIRRIEEGRGKPTVRTMFLIAQAFDVEVLELWPLNLT
jgi:transcriptional regulator with XRE-family HTH domain